MANILVNHKDKQGKCFPVGTFSQKQKVWDYIEPELNENFSLRVFPNVEKEYKINKATLSRLLKEETGVVFREAGKIRFIALNLEQNPER